MSEFSPKNPTPAAANLTPGDQPMAYLDNVKRLLDSEEVAQMPADEQGKAIMDHFIGGLVADDGAVSSHGEHQKPQDVLKVMDKLPKALTPESQKEVLSYVTASNGLRPAIYALAGDVRTGSLLGSLSDRLHVSEDGKYTFKSIGQVGGYLDAKSREDSQPTRWKRQLLEAVSSYSESPRGALSAWNNDLLESEVDSLRQSQLEFQEAVKSAHYDGVDTDLVGRSAELIKRNRAEGQYIGSITIAQALDPGNNYDHLFK